MSVLNKKINEIAPKYNGKFDEVELMSYYTLFISVYSKELNSLCEERDIGDYIEEFDFVATLFIQSVVSWLKKYGMIYGGIADAIGYKGFLNNGIVEIDKDKAMSIQDVIDELMSIQKEKRDLPLYVSNEDGDNLLIKSISLYDIDSEHSKENMLGVNYIVE